MDFGWTDEQAALRSGAVEFATRRLADGVIERDRDGVFSRELWDACAEFGLQGLMVPDEWNGAGHDLLSAVAILEGIGYGARDNGLVFSVAAHAASCEGPLSEFGSDEQKHEWLPRLADGSAIGATGITEPDSGSNALALATTRRREPGRLGSRRLEDLRDQRAGGGPVPHLCANRRLGFCGHYVLPDSAGLRRADRSDRRSRRWACARVPMSQVFLENCRVPASAVIGGVGSGAMIFNQTMDLERLLVMAPAIGVMERLLERCVAHARQRTAGSVPIGKHQSIAHRIADMELELEAARLLLYRAAWHRMHHGSATRESALAKLAVSEAYVACCRSAVQIFGGYGYMVEYELERELRDALATTLYVGTSEIQRNLIAGLRGLG